MGIDILARKLCDLDQDELEQILKFAKEQNEDIIQILHEALEEI